VSPAPRVGGGRGGGADPRSRVGAIEGRQACAAGIASKGFPLEANAVRSAAGAKA